MSEVEKELLKETFIKARSGQRKGAAASQMAWLYTLGKKREMRRRVGVEVGEKRRQRCEGWRDEESTS